MIKLLSMGLAAVLLSVPGELCAQGFPSRTVTLVVPFAAGGPSDTVARLIAQSMAKTLGQQVIVENVGGAGGTIGTARVAKAAADGYTTLLHHSGMATSATLYRNLPYDTRKDFAPIGLVVDVPMTIVARPGYAPNSLSEVLKDVAARPNGVTYAHAGIGSAAHLCGLLLMEVAGQPVQQIAYRGTGPAMNDLVGGQVDLMCDQTTNTTAQIQGRQVKAYAVTTAARLPTLPDVPSVGELGLRSLEVTNWHGLYAPAGTPQPAVARLGAALRAALKEPFVTQRFAELGGTAASDADAIPEALGRKLDQEIDRWAPLITKANAFAN